MRLVGSGCVLLFLIASPQLSLGEDDFTLEKGFARLDNGKDLDGWTGNKTGWSVRQGGVIHLDVKRAKGDIYSTRQHGRNCIIRLQFRAPQGADSGVATPSALLYHVKP